MNFKDKIPYGLDISKYSLKYKSIESKSKHSEFYVFESIFSRNKVIAQKISVNILIPSKLEALDQLYDLDHQLYSKFDSESLNTLIKIIDFVYNYYGSRWAITYCQNYIQYAIWFFSRIILKRNQSIIFNLDKNTIIKLLEFSKNILISKIYWDDHDRTRSNSFFLESSRILSQYFSQIIQNDQNSEIFELLITLFKEMEKNLS
jgi:hypothetical protein